jgi:hypothetical protein
MSKEEFEDKYGAEYAKNMEFTRDLGGFNWSFQTDKGKVILVCDYYYKKKTKFNIVQLIDGQVMPEKEYKKFIKEWQEDPDKMIVPPIIVGEPRETEKVTICRCIFTENDILKHEETDLPELPIIFVEGNSVMIREDNGGTARQVTRSYLYHAEGIQRLKNFSGIMLANELENLVQHKFMVAKEAIPAEYSAAYKDVQRASVLVYNGFKADDPNVPLSPPTAVPRVPCPPEVISTFSMSNETTQAILGSYDAALGINNNQLSGIAIQEGATQSNATAMPYIVGYMKALNHAANMIVKMIPLKYDRPRKVATKDIRGNSQYVPINQRGGLDMNYDSDSLEVKVEAGVNFEIQRQRALQTLEGLMKVSPTLTAYFNEEEGLEMLLDNIDIRGIDALKVGVAKFMQKQEKMKAESKQMAMMTNPAMMKMQELQVKDKQNQAQNQLEAARIAVEKQDADTKQMEMMTAIGEKADRIQIDNMKIAAEEARTDVERASQMASHQHGLAMDILDHHHMQKETKHNHAMEVLALHHENERHKKNLESKNQPKPTVDIEVE